MADVLLLKHAGRTGSSETYENRSPEVFVVVGIPFLYLSIWLEKGWFTLLVVAKDTSWQAFLQEHDKNTER